MFSGKWLISSLPYLVCGWCYIYLAIDCGRGKGGEDAGPSTRVVSAVYLPGGYHVPMFEQERDGGVKHGIFRGVSEARAVRRGLLYLRFVA